MSATSAGLYPAASSRPDTSGRQVTSNWPSSSWSGYGSRGGSVPSQPGGTERIAVYPLHQVRIRVVAYVVKKRRHGELLFVGLFQMLLVNSCAQWRVP